jgi:hypothetical protein
MPCNIRKGETETAGNIGFCGSFRLEENSTRNEPCFFGNSLGKLGRPEVVPLQISSLRVESSRPRSDPPDQ